MVRLIGGVIFLVVTAIAAAAGAGVALRAAIVERVVEGAMRDAGVENPSVTAERVALDGVELTDITGAGAPGSLAIDRIAVDFSLREALFQRRIRRLAVGPGRVEITVRSQDAERLSGAAGGGGTGANDSGVTIDAIEVEALAVAVIGAGDDVEGRFDGVLNAAVNADGAGAASLVGAADAFRWGDQAAETVALSVEAKVAADGSARVESALSGALETAAGRVDALDVFIDGTLKDWRADPQGLAGEAVIDIRSGRLTAAGGADARPADGPAADGVAHDAFADQVSLAGRMRAVRDGDDVEIAFAEGGDLRLETGTGDLAVLRARDGAPLYRREAGVQDGAVSAAFSGPRGSGSFDGSLRVDAADRWRFDGALALVEPVFGPAAVRGASLVFEGTGADLGARFGETGTAQASLAFAADLARAQVGRLIVENAPFAAELQAGVDFPAGVATLRAPEGVAVPCALLDRFAARFLGDTPTRARFSQVRICAPADGDFVRADWSGPLRLAVAAGIDARDAVAEVGETRARGVMPKTTVRAVYTPDDHVTIADGRIEGGRMVLNDAVAASVGAATFEGRLTRENLTGAGRFDGVRMAQPPTLTPDGAEAAALFAPVLLSGDAQLSDGRVTFDAAAAGLDGTPLGAASGEHRLDAGVGSATFSSGALVFAPGGVRPDELAPVLRGLIGTAAGAVSVDARAAWSPRAPLETSADITLDNLSFRGPGAAVSQTRGVRGEIALASLVPLRTAGPQRLEIAAVDLDALVLERGAATFDLPGDDTFRLIQAEFPWFGGVIGAYDAALDLVQGEATVALQARNVDLGAFLAFLKIDGLAGEGVVEGELPIRFDGARAFVEDGALRAVGQGVIRYSGAASEAAATRNDQARLAFDALREFSFETLRADVNGPLDGDLLIGLYFEGTSAIAINNQIVNEPVVAPFIYRVNVEAPILSLLQSAAISAEAERLVRERARRRLGIDAQDEQGR